MPKGKIKIGKSKKPELNQVNLDCLTTNTKYLKIKQNKTNKTKENKQNKTTPFRSFKKKKMRKKRISIGLFLQNAKRLKEK